PWVTTMCAWTNIPVLTNASSGLLKPLGWLSITTVAPPHLNSIGVSPTCARAAWIKQRSRTMPPSRPFMSGSSLVVGCRVTVTQWTDFRDKTYACAEVDSQAQGKAGNRRVENVVRRRPREHGAEESAQRCFIVQPEGFQQPPAG